jgi:hypothetical protein
MNTRRSLILLLSLCALAHLSDSQLQAAPKPTEEDAPKLPEIWEKAGPQERLKALRAAELDGDRLLAERVYGLMVDADTSVQDLALQNDAVKGAIRATLIGAVTAGDPEYMPDGRVQVVRAVKIREITDTLNRVIKGKRLQDGSLVTTEDKAKTDRDVKDKVIDVVGNAALPGSEGQQKIMAKRAAELDAYRRLAGRMLGVKIKGDTTVREMVLADDRILAALSQSLKAATPTAIKYNKGDGSCAVTMEVKVSDIIRTTERYVKGDTTRTEIHDEIETKTFSETGMGTMKPFGETKGGGEAPVANGKGSDSSEPFFQTTTILKQIVQSTPVVH